MRFLNKFLVLTVTFAMGCAEQDVKRFSDRAELEGRASSKAEQDIINARAQEMEADLSRRQRFYQAMSGIYQGEFTTAQGITFVSKIRVLPSVPAYVPSNRVRTPNEVEADINNLYFNIQILHWSPSHSSSAAGCVFEGVRADLEKGRVDMAQAACPNVYSVRILNPTESHEKQADLEQNSVVLAQLILNGSVNRVSSLKIFMQASNQADEYELNLVKVE